MSQAKTNEQAAGAAGLISVDFNTAYDAVTQITNTFEDILSKGPDYNPKQVENEIRKWTAQRDFRKAITQAMFHNKIEKSDHHIEVGKFLITTVVVISKPDGKTYSLKNLLASIQDINLFDNIGNEIIEKFGDVTYEHTEELSGRVCLFNSRLEYSTIINDAEQLALYKEYNIVQALLLLIQLAKYAHPLLPNPEPGIIFFLEHSDKKERCGISLHCVEEKMQLKLGSINTERRCNPGSSAVFNKGDYFN